MSLPLRRSTVPRPWLGDSENDDRSGRSERRALRAVRNERDPERDEHGTPAVRRILIADDDDDLRSALAMALEIEGWTVLEARDGEEALAMAREARPSVILLDCRMPKKSGQEVYRELRGGGDSTPVLIVTAGTDVRQIAAELGNPHFLGKPFDIDQLCAALDGAEESSPGRRGR
jgi:DNA-binding NtrC family response regulator